MKKVHLLLIVSLLALGIGGGFTPWIYKPPIALQLTAPGLAEYVKFLAEVRLGLLPIQRLHFLLPLAIAALSLPPVVVNGQLNIHWSLNWFLRLSVIPLALALLSPVWAPGVLLNDEFRLQTIVALIAVGLTVIAPFFKKLPLKWLITIVALTSIIGLGLALRQFWLANEAIAATYASSVRLGWGGWLTISGVIGLVVSVSWFWLLDGAKNDSYKNQ